ncbi:prion-like-(Q/N-rich) domain-bearing protein 25 isoform X1 [Diabrotica virgifera virgifera]|uniref:EB domain-containing protein n=1 Tax=Diabrotica virgifera virgifera TaxID=50390 RepID=A0ABM5KBS2_DIAVI|nr:prion-like-(Q/N-rich) domain-bearing protein 25 isoform X1 [Diabrotica virgifera virgifera]
MSSTVVYLIVFVVSVVTVVCDHLSDSLLEQLMAINSYTKCRVDADCAKISDHTFCFGNDADKDGYCRCKENYDMVSRNKTFFACLGRASVMLGCTTPHLSDTGLKSIGPKFYATAGLGEKCEKNMQCQIVLTENSECANSVCRCKNGAHLYKDGRCYVSVLLGDFCRGSANCWLASNQFGNCVYGKCTCKFDNEVPGTDRMSCVHGKKIGEQCESDNQCSLTENTQCKTVCRCSPGFVMSRDQTRCLKAATRFNDVCLENDQCSASLQGSICLSNNCTCDIGFHSLDLKCVKTASFGGPCSNSEECVRDSSHLEVIHCNNGECQCKPGAVNETLGCTNRSNFIVQNSFVVILLGLVLKFL